METIGRNSEDKLSVSLIKDQLYYMSIRTLILRVSHILGMLWYFHFYIKSEIHERPYGWVGSRFEYDETVVKFRSDAKGIVIYWRDTERISKLFVNDF